MKKLLLTSAAAGALALVGGNAFAADIIPVPPPPVIVPPPVVEAAYDWTGPYIGLTGGLAVRQFTFPWNFVFEVDGPEYVATGDGVAATSAGGFTAGVLAGFNFQRNNLVFGIEGDWNWTNFRSFVEIDGTIVPPADPPINFAGEAFVGVDWFATLRARLGFATGHEGRFLPYVTGGLAYGKTTLGYDFTFDDGIDPPETGADSIDFTNWGWTVGGGFEYAFNDRMTFKTEYLFVNLGSNNLVALEDEGDEFNIDVTTRFHTLRAGFTFQF